MDDDQPLAALSKAAVPKVEGKYDDDTPLAILAMDTKPARSSTKGAAPKAPSRSSLGGASAKGKGSGKGKQATPSKAKDGESSSDSSSDSSSSDSDSDSDAPLAKKRASQGQQRKLLKKVKSEAMLEDTSNSVKKRDRPVKEQIVAELLARWWYCLPEWPPEDPAYYEAELKKRSLRRVDIMEWEWVPEVDAQGRHKVYELSQFRGLFRNSAGELIDTRPKNSCPCFSNFVKKEMHELCDLLVVAYENQLKDLKNSKFNEDHFEQGLKAALERARNRAHEARQLGSVRRQSAG